MAETTTSIEFPENNDKMRCKFITPAASFTEAPPNLKTFTSSILAQINAFQDEKPEVAQK